MKPKALLAIFLNFLPCPYCSRRNSIEICVGLTQHKEEIRNLSEKKERYNTNTRKITPPFFFGGVPQKEARKKEDKY